MSEHISDSIKVAVVDVGCAEVIAFVSLFDLRVICWKAMIGCIGVHILDIGSQVIIKVINDVHGRLTHKIILSTREEPDLSALDVTDWINEAFLGRGFSIVDQSLVFYVCLIFVFAFFFGKDLSASPGISSNDACTRECGGENGEHVSGHKATCAKA